MIGPCCCTLAGTKACDTCSNNKDIQEYPEKVISFYEKIREIDGVLNNE